MKKIQIIFLWKIIPPSSSLFVRSEKKMQKRNKGQVIRLGWNLFIKLFVK
jgi:hypothetical protein